MNYIPPYNRILISTEDHESIVAITDSRAVAQALKQALNPLEWAALRRQITTMIPICPRCDKKMEMTKE